MSNKTRIALALAAGTVLGAALSLSQGVLADRNSDKTAQIPAHSLRLFTEVLDRVQSQYVDPVTDDKLIENAVRGMLEGLDPHSSFLDKEEFEDMNTTTSGKFGGLGIEVQMRDGLVYVVSPIDDTPAARAGIQSGDYIAKINGESVRGLNLKDAVDKMRGDPGTPVTITVLRQNAEKPLTFEMKRDVIAVVSSKSRLLDKGYGYLRISQFTGNTGDAVAEELKKLKKDGELRGLVLDLRNNPGGVLQAAVQVADLFLDRGVVVSIKGREPSSNRDFLAEDGDQLAGRPIVVLVNGGSASAAEIVAGALQDSKRAVLMGTKTFGKGSVQSILPISKETAIKLTTARYYTPSGRSIQAEGISPDVVLSALKLAKAEADPFESLREKESDLKGRLEKLAPSKGDDAAKKPEPKTDAEKAAAADEAARKQQDEAQKLAESDYALYEALNLLKGLAIARGF